MSHNCKKWINWNINDYLLQGFVRRHVGQVFKQNISVRSIRRNKSHKSTAIKSTKDCWIIQFTNTEMQWISILKFSCSVYLRPKSYSYELSSFNNSCSNFIVIKEVAIKDDSEYNFSNLIGLKMTIGNLQQITIGVNIRRKIILVYF